MAATSLPLLVRQPVVNRSQEIVGYDLRLAAEAPNTALLKVLSEGSAESFFTRLPNRFVVSADGQVDTVKPITQLSGRLVLELDVAPKDGETLVAREKKTKSAGYGVSLKQAHLAEVPAEALDLASYLCIDAAELNGDLEKTCTRLRKFAAKQLAVNVSSSDDFERTHRAGCEMFRGYFFTRPKLDQAHAISPNYTTIVNVMKLAQENAPVAKIEDALKRDAALSFKLLRYINSAGFGLQCEIESFRHAVAVLGYQNLYRWLALLMVTAARQSASSALVTTAITRGRLAELLGGSLFDRSECDNLFIVGAFSLLDAILRAPLDQIAEQIPLSQSVLDALFRRDGPYGPILSVIEAVEQLHDNGARDSAMETAGLLGLTTNEVNRAQLEAVIWAEGLGK
jgi:EAL and modified HD-GYP domain-containing signal transduction protein